MNDQDDHDSDHSDQGNHRVDDDDNDDDGDDSEHVGESRCLPCGTPCLQKLKLNPTCPYIGQQLLSLHISFHYITFQKLK